MSGVPLRSCKMEEMAWRIAAGTMSYVTGRLGVSKRTLARWKTRDDFRRRVTELRAEMTREGCGRLTENMVKAADALSYLLKSENERVKLRAAEQMLTIGTKLREMVEFEERLEVLEQRLVK